MHRRFREMLYARGSIGCGRPRFFRGCARSGARALALAVRSFAMRGTVAAIPASAAAPAATATLGALTLMRCRRAGLLARDRRKIGIHGTRLALLPWLAALTVLLLLAAAIALTFAAFAAMAIAWLIAITPGLLLRGRLLRTRLLLLAMPVAPSVPTLLAAPLSAVAPPTAVAAISPAATAVSGRRYLARRRWCRRGLGRRPLEPSQHGSEPALLAWSRR